MAALPELDVTQPIAGSNLVAQADGSDDGPAIQARIDVAASTAPGGCVYFPPGSYRIGTPLRVSGSDTTVALRGCGASSHLLWDFDGDLLRWEGRIYSAAVHDLWVTAQQNMSASSAMLRAAFGLSNFTVSGVRLHVADPLTMRAGSGIVLSEPGASPPPSWSGSVRLDDLELWYCRDAAIRISDLTDVWLRGCRVPAAWRPVTPASGSIGLHVAGNNGGVWVENCDFSECETAILVSRTGTRVGRRIVRRRENRELFVSGGACDGGLHGLVVRDTTFVTVTGAWLASNDAENLLVDAGWAPSVVLTGGMVFNAGSWLQPKPQPLRSHGIVVEGGALVMNGVLVDNNAGIGVKLGPNVRSFTVSGCTLRNNWTRAFDVAPSCGALFGNTVQIGQGGAPSIPPFFSAFNFICP